VTLGVADGFGVGVTAEARALFEALLSGETFGPDLSDFPGGEVRARSFTPFDADAALFDAFI
jgi:hypothetical protein